MTVLDDKLIIAGGETKIDYNKVTSKVLVLDKGEWKDYGAMPTARRSAAAVGYQSMLIIVGGDTKVKGERILLATAEILDTTNGCWYTCDHLPVPHCQPKFTIINNTLYLLGEVNENLNPSPQVFSASLDNLSRHQLKWQSLPDIPWRFSAPVVLYNKFLLTVGGRQPSDDNSQTNEVCAFNSLTGLWKRITNIPSARSFPAVVDVAENKIIVLGGLTQQRKFSNKVWVGMFE